VGDILYDNFTKNGNNELTSLGTNAGNPIAVCVLPNGYCSDSKARFCAYDFSMTDIEHANGLLVIKDVAQLTTEIIWFEDSKPSYGSGNTIDRSSATPHLQALNLHFGSVLDP